MSGHRLCGAPCPLYPPKADITGTLGCPLGAVIAGIQRDRSEMIAQLVSAVYRFWHRASDLTTAEKNSAGNLSRRFEQIGVAVDQALGSRPVGQSQSWRSLSSREFAQRGEQLIVGLPDLSRGFRGNRLGIRRARIKLKFRSFDTKICESSLRLLSAKDRIYFFHRRPRM